MKNRIGGGILQLSAGDYHADRTGSEPSLSCSIAKILLNKSPAHARLAHPRLNPDYVDMESASQMDIGTAAHALLLEGVDKVTVCDFDDWRKKDAQTARDDARANGRIPLLRHQFDTVQAMCAAAQNALQSCDELGGIDFSWGKAEQTVLWREKFTSTHCRIRTDWLQVDNSLIIDYKTTAIANPAAWMRSISAQGYDIQASFYRRGIKAVTGKEPKFVFMVQETEAPYLCYFVSLPQTYLEIGHQKVEMALNKWAACMKANQWPGYAPRIIYAEPANWQLAEAEEMASELQNPNGIVLFDKDAIGAKENFLFGKVKEKKNEYAI